MKITFDDLERWGYDSVTDYCRHLVEYAPESGQDLKDKIEVYRGDMLCLTVQSIEEGAKLEPTGTRFAKYTVGHGLKARRSHAKPRGCV